MKSKHFAEVEPKC